MQLSSEKKILIDGKDLCEILSAYGWKFYKFYSEFFRKMMNIASFCNARLAVWLRLENLFFISIILST